MHQAVFVSKLILKNYLKTYCNLLKLLVALKRKIVNYIFISGVCCIYFIVTLYILIKYVVLIIIAF